MWIKGDRTECRTDITELVNDETLDILQVSTKDSNTIMQKLNDGGYAEAGLELLQTIIDETHQRYNDKISNETPTAMLEEYKHKIEVIKYIRALYNARLIGEDLE